MLCYLDIVHTYCYIFLHNIHNYILDCILHHGSHCHTHAYMFHLYDDIALTPRNFHILNCNYLRMFRHDKLLYILENGNQGHILEHKFQLYGDMLSYLCNVHKCRYTALQNTQMSILQYI